MKKMLTVLVLLPAAGILFANAGVFRGNGTKGNGSREVKHD